MKEKNINILQRAIKELPSFYCNEDIWPKIDDNIPESSSFQKLNLPTYSPPEYLWSDIEQKLNEQAKFFEFPKKKLPTYSAPEGLWRRIEIRLNRKGKIQKLITTRFIKYAASLLLLVSIGVGTNTLPKTNYKILVQNTQKLIHQWGVSDKEETGIETIFTPAMCANNVPLCNNPIIIELNSQLADIQSDISSIKELINENNDPQILKYYYRLKNQQVEIEKKILKLIIQS